MSYGYTMCVFGAVVSIALCTHMLLVIGYSSPTDQAEEVKETTTVDLGDLLDARDSAMVTLVAGNTRLVAHGAVLAAGSTVFAALLGNDTLETSSGQISIPDVKGPVLRQLLAYLYTGRAPQLPDMAPALLDAANKYGVSGLRAQCERQLGAQLTVETAAATAVLTMSQCCPSLKQAVVSFMKAHTHQVMATQGWADAVINHAHTVVEFTRLIAEPPAQWRSLCSEETGRRLILAAQHGAVEELQPLLAAGADVGATDKWGWTALHWAAQEGHVEVVRRLLRSGAEVGARDVMQWTPLHRAATHGHAAVVRLLAAASADPGARDDNGLTPLHVAALNGHAEAVAALLAAGADRGAATNRGSIPLDFVRQKNREELTEMLT